MQWGQGLETPLGHYFSQHAFSLVLGVNHSGFIAVPEKASQAPLTGGRRECPCWVQWPPEGAVKATMQEPGGVKGAEKLF